MTAIARAVLCVLSCALVCVPAALRPASAAPPHAIMVLYFDNDSGDKAFDHLGKGLADMTATDLSTVPGLQILEREKLEAVLSELKLQRTKYFDPATAQRIGKGIGAEFVVTGSFVSVAPDVRLDVRVVKIATGDVVRARRVVGQAERFFELQEQLMAALADGLATALTIAKLPAKATSRVDDVRTAASYGDGLDLRDAGSLQDASAKMQTVMAKAPELKIARARYMEMMKALYAAKDARAGAMAAAEKELFELLDLPVQKVFAGKATYTNRYILLAKPILRGDLFLRRLAATLDGPAIGYEPHLRAWLDNQEQLVGLLERWAYSPSSDYLVGGRHRPSYGECGSYPHLDWCVGERALALVAQLGLADPTRDVRRAEPHQILQDMAELLMSGQRPFHSPVQLQKRICFYKLDVSFAERALAFLVRGEKVLERYSDEYNPLWIDAEHISLTTSRAEALLRLGKAEDAVAALQSALTRFPKAQAFPQVEAMVRGILAGDGKLPSGKPILAACEEPI